MSLVLGLVLVFRLGKASPSEPHPSVHNRAAGAIGYSTYNSSSIPSTSRNPCASVSAIVATRTADVQHTIEVSAQLAYDCLQSVPLDKANATRLINSFRTMFQFQSTTSFNKNPPNSYKMPAVDAVAILDQIEANITSGVYNGEYVFQVALYKLVIAIHDDHLEYIPDLLADVFSFTRPISLTSFSEEGTSLPNLYVVEDLSATSLNSTKASAITSINGQSANTFLEDLSHFETGQDPDTNYNRLLKTLAAFSGGNETGSFSKSQLFSGANTTLQFANGTIAVFENKAIVRTNFSSIDSPEALYAQVCQERYRGNQSGERSQKTSRPDASTNDARKRSVGHQLLLSRANATSSTDGMTEDDGDNDDDDDDKPQPALVGYPSPIVRQAQNIISGYHLNGSYSNTAVLVITGFGNGKEFQSVVSEFLVKSKQAQKTKLIIDIQSNGGGDEDPEYDMFGQLFPSKRVYEASAWRASPIFKAISQNMDQLRQSSGQNLSSEDRSFLTTTTPDHESFNFRDEITVNFTNFVSFDQYFGPFEFNGDNFTSAAQTNLSTPVGGRQQGINDITGYGRKANTSTAVFQPENIVVLTNGDCSSMCASFVEQTRTEVGLRFIAVGGRPAYGEMAIAGGTHGYACVNPIPPTGVNTI